VPVGIVAAISPFNFPLNLVAHKVGPALAAGCTVVLKPASATPLSAWRLACLLEEAGLPPGVLNVVYGEGATVGERLVADPRVAAVSFTGSAAVGRRIAALAAPRRVVLELGGNCGVLLDADTDLARAVPRCVESAFAHAGQVCISLQRIYVHAALAEPFTAAFLEAAAQVVAGDPADPATVAGPMIRPAEAERAVAWVEEARAAGARVLLGGGREGALMAPTVLDRVAPEMRVVRDEVFAPVVTIASVPDFEEGLRQLGDSAFGLQAGVYTRDLGRALSAARRLDVGGVMVNDTPIFRVDHMPYGGNRGSGLGREGVRFAVEEYTTPRMVVIDPG
jgi:acyl-CoA reductase-like NAD-dependent aldehyde dehydrogenase